MTATYTAAATLEAFEIGTWEIDFG